MTQGFSKMSQGLNERVTQVTRSDSGLFTYESGVFKNESGVKSQSDSSHLECLRAFHKMSQGFISKSYEFEFTV